MPFVFNCFVQNTSNINWFLLFFIGLEGEKTIGIDDIYKPRKWSQVQDGPYRMVVSSRDQVSNESQLDSRKGTRTRHGSEESKEDKTNKSEVIDSAPDNTKDEVEADLESSSDQGPITISRTSKDSTHDGVTSKARIDRRKSKVKFEHDQVIPISSDNFSKNEKSTQRTITKLARKRERILSNENFRKAHRVSIPEGYFSTAYPSTISHKLYNHFRPIEHGIPRESIIPFFDFGKKLSTGKTPSAINSIEGSSTPGVGNYEMTTRREEEELFHEEMDVSVVKVKPVERNAAPRIRAPLRNPEITSFYKSIPSESTSEEDPVADATTPLSEFSRKDFTTDAAVYTFPPTEPSTTIPTTLRSLEHTGHNFQLNDKKQNSSVPPTKEDDHNPSIPSANGKGMKSSIKSNFSTQLPRPSPTAKVLSTAVVTSVSVKETYRHPRIKGIDSIVEELEVKSDNVKKELLPLKFQNESDEGNSSSDPIRFNSNHTYRVDKSLGTAIPTSTHRPSFERSLKNRTSASFNNSTIHPTTIRPKFRANIEHHSLSTKAPSSITNKFLNRSLYSTYQREQQKHKFLSPQQFKVDNKSVIVLQINDSSPRTTSKLNTNENKTKMFLTIRSRLPNQSATFRSTFRRNGTKQIPPVLRVIATPSSYIEVPRIISKVLNNSTSTIENSKIEMEPTNEFNIKKSSHLNDDESGAMSNNSSTVRAADNTTSDTHSINQPKSSNVPKMLSGAREVRMNNHRMPANELTTISDNNEELSTVVSVDSATEHLDDIVPTQSSRTPTNDPINIITVGPGTTSTKPGLSWVYLGQKNRTRIVDNSAVEVAYTKGFGIAAYVLAALGVVPLILGGFVLLRQIFIKSKKKVYHLFSLITCNINK